MTDGARYWAVVPAAGIGRRMGTDIPKQFLELGGKSVLGHSLDALYGIRALEGLVLVAGDGSAAASIREAYRGRVLLQAGGGKERCHSVLNGLQVLADHAAIDDWVLVHDAARPCVRSTDLECLLQAVSASNTGGLLGLPVRDTMKRTNTDGMITGTLDRDHMWHAFTPQMFRYGVLQEALRQALREGFEVTDEASAMEHAGYNPRMVEGHADNIKITRPEDLPLAEFFLAQQGRL